MFLIFDTETTGLPRSYKAPISDSQNWPRIVQLAWQLHDEKGELLEQSEYLVHPDGFDIPFESERIHGISTALALEEGLPLKEVLDRFENALKKARFVVGQNVDFDIKVTGAELYRLGRVTELLVEKPVLDTCTETTASLCQLPGGRGGNLNCPHLPNCISTYLTRPSKRLTMPVPTFRPLRAASSSWFAHRFSLLINCILAPKNQRNSLHFITLQYRPTS
jgi:DNA polymerase III subunit alpha